MTYGEPIEVRPDLVLDDEQNPVPGSGGTFTVYGAVEPGGGEENADRGRNGASTRIRVYVEQPPAQPVSRHAVLIVRGKPYRVTAEPALWADPDGGELGGLVLDAERTEG